MPFSGGNEVSEYAEITTIDGSRISEASSHKPPFTVEDGLDGNSLLGANPYGLDTGEGGTNTLLHDLGVEGENNRLTAGG